MKTKLLFLGLLLLGLSGFTSCGDDDDDNGGGNDSLVGTWKGTVGGEVELFKYLASGDFVQVNLYGEDDDDGTVRAGSYTTSGTTLTLTIGGKSSTATYSISGDKVNVKVNGQSVYFTKVSDSVIAGYMAEFKNIDRSSIVGAWKAEDGYIYIKDDGTIYAVDLSETPVSVVEGTWNLYKNVLSVFYSGEESYIDNSIFVLSVNSTTMTVKAGKETSSATKCPVSEVEPYLPK